MKRKIQLISGYLFLIPGVFGALIFIIDMTWVFWRYINSSKGYETVLGMFYSYSWFGFGNEGGGYTPALPFYLGLMSIAGAYLIANTKDIK